MAIQEITETELVQRCAKCVEQYRKGGGNQRVEAVEPPKLGIGGKIADERHARCEVLACKEPAQMTPEETMLPGRVTIGRGIRVPVMMAVVKLASTVSMRM